MRDAVLSLLATDAVLNAAPYELTVDNIHTAYGMDGSRITPNMSPKGYFVILRWEETTPGPGLRTVLSIWMHKDKNLGENFVPLHNGLLRIRQVMTSTYHRAGADGGKMSMANFTGMGSDQVDTSYNTITKYAAFIVLSGQS